MPVAGANLWWWGTEKLIDGWMALLILSVALAAAGKFLRPEKTGSSDAK
jgi:hypothetical protein